MLLLLQRVLLQSLLLLELECLLLPLDLPCALLAAAAEAEE